MLSCNELKSWMVEFIYGEMSEEKESLFQEHLQSCPACRSELSGLQDTRETLAEWPDALPRGAWFTHADQSLPRWRNLPALHKWVLATAFAAMLVLVALAALNTRISYDQDRWQLSMSLRAQPPALPQDAVVLSKEDLYMMEQQRWRLIQTALKNSENSQRIQWSADLAKMAQYIDQQRDQDLHLVSRGLEAIGEQTATRMAVTDRVLTQVLELAYSDQIPQQ